MNTRPNPLEVLLAQLYADPAALDSFLKDRRKMARTFGVREDQIAAVEEIDAESLRFAVNSFARKRNRSR
jgi:hypothetical protein